MTYSISDIKDRWGDIYTPSEKVFYKQYQYKVSLFYPSYDEYYMKPLRSKWVDDLANKGVDVLIKRGPIHHRYRGTFGAQDQVGALCIYMKTADDVYKFVETYQYFLKRIDGPFDEQTESVIAETSNERNKITRQKLFYNKYKYCIDLHVTFEMLKKKDSIYDSILNTVEYVDDFKLSLPLQRIVDYQGDLSKVTTYGLNKTSGLHYMLARTVNMLKNTHPNAPKVVPYTIYLKNEADLVNLQMTVDAQFSNATEIVLI